MLAKQMEAVMLIPQLHTHNHAQQVLKKKRLFVHARLQLVQNGLFLLHKASNSRVGKRFKKAVRLAGSLFII